MKKNAKRILHDERYGTVDQCKFEGVDPDLALEAVSLAKSNADETYVNCEGLQNYPATRYLIEMIRRSEAPTVLDTHMSLHNVDVGEDLRFRMQVRDSKIVVIPFLARDLLFIINEPVGSYGMRFCESDSRLFGLATHYYEFRSGRGSRFGGCDELGDDNRFKISVSMAGRYVEPMLMMVIYTDENQHYHFIRSLDD